MQFLPHRMKTKLEIEVSLFTNSVINLLIFPYWKDSALGKYPIKRTENFYFHIKRSPIVVFSWDSTEQCISEVTIKALEWNRQKS